jgi:hypothetical protein
MAQFSGPSGFAQFSGPSGLGLGSYLVKSPSPTLGLGLRPNPPLVISESLVGVDSLDSVLFFS